MLAMKPAWGYIGFDIAECLVPRKFEWLEYGTTKTK
jgi:hypothetical protein